MVEMLFGGLLLVSCLGGFVHSFNCSGFHRGYMNLYGGVIEACIANFNNLRPDNPPYFDQDLIETYLPKYIDINMRPYTVSLRWSYKVSDYWGSLGAHHLEIYFTAHLGLKEIRKSSIYSIVEVSAS